MLDPVVGERGEQGGHFRLGIRVDVLVPNGHVSDVFGDVAAYQPLSFRVGQQH